MIPFDREQAYRAASLETIAQRFDLSLGDCVCLSLAKEMNVKVLTADIAWQPAATELEVDVKLIR